MSESIRTHLRTNVVGYVALAVAVAGVPTAWAVARNSVGSAQIKPKAVKNGDLADNSVTSPKVANGSLLGEDFDAGELPQGPAGPAGETGPAGQNGVNGTNGTNGTDGDDGIDGDDGSPDTPAQVLAKLMTVDTDTSGLNADTVDGLNAASFAQAGSEGYHVVGDAGQPTYNAANGFIWESTTFGESDIRFFRDPSGVVHLEGQAKINVPGFATSGGMNSVFTLPAGYRSQEGGTFVVNQSGAGSNQPPVAVTVTSAGVVALHNPLDAVADGALVDDDRVDMIGISFRCSPAGSNGCP